MIIEVTPLEELRENLIMVLQRMAEVRMEQKVLIKKQKDHLFLAEKVPVNLGVLLQKVKPQEARRVTKVLTAHVRVLADLENNLV